MPEEASWLLPRTTYHYAIVANNGNATTIGPEATFTTAYAEPLTTPLAIGSSSAQFVNEDSAVISGVVDPDGQPARYAFELGIYNGTATQYGIVLSAPAGSGTVPVEETLALSGLQPGTTYAYRIKVSSGYGTSFGEPVMFTTFGLPSVLSSPPLFAMLPVPPIAFPSEGSKPSGEKCKRGFKSGKHGRCVRFKARKRRTGKRSVGHVK